MVIKSEVDSPVDVNRNIASRSNLNHQIMPKNNSKRRLDFAEEESEAPINNPYKQNKSSVKENDSTAVTPEAGIEKFLTRNRDSKPKAARQLVTPQKSKEHDIYYESGEEEEEVFKPTHIHANVDYHRRGDLALDATTLKVYRFVRDHFLIPKSFEADYKFGPLSGSCFEERVVRAYSLGELKAKKGLNEVDLQVCTYCGVEGHVKGDCNDLL